jgi:hypothetical protein
MQPGPPSAAVSTRWAFVEALPDAPYRGLWQLQQLETPGAITLVPDLSVHLCFDLSGLIDVEPFLLHPALERVTLALPAGAHLVGVQFAVWHALPLIEAAGDAPGVYSVSFDAEWAPGIYVALLNQRARLARLDDVSMVLKRYGGWISGALGDDTRQALVVAAVDGGAADGYSARQARRLYREIAGLSPVQVRRVLRFQRALQALLATGSTAAALAADDFSDQAHMIREFRQFAGMTPTQLLRAHR